MKMSASDGRQSQLPTKKRLRFREEDDLALLREVLSLNPFQNGNLWEDIQEHVMLLTGKNFLVKALRDHLLLLIKLWLEKNKVLKDKSGFEETYFEKDQLCSSVHQIMIENAKEKCLAKKRKTINLGKIDRDRWAEESSHKILKENIEPSVNHDVSPDVIYFPADVKETVFVEHAYVSTKEEDVLLNKEVAPETSTNSKIQTLSNKASKSTLEKKKVLERVRSRVRRTSAQRQGLEYLERFDREQNESKKTEHELTKEKIEIDRQKLVLENRRLALEKRRFSLEEFERKKYIEILEKKIENEKQERGDLLKIIERQESLINILLSKNNEQSSGNTS